MVSIQMEYDDLAWERSEEMFEIWKRKLYSGDTSHNVAMLAEKYRPGTAVKLHDPVCGSYNVCLRVDFKLGGPTMIRFAVGGQVMFPEEKIRAEVAVMRFIADNTTIPVPLVSHAGTASESTGGLGPFIVMEYIEHHHSLNSALNIPGRPRDKRPLLDPDISEENLESAYNHMANILLQLSQPSLAAIGSLSETADFEWSVTERPMTFNFNGLVQLGDVRSDRLPAQVYRTASSYYLAMAQMHIEHLTSQHNDAVASEDDCRRKYVARHLFYNLAADGRLDSFPEFENGPFKLFCEDLRPSNVLVTERNALVGVVDWEFTFSGPVGLAFSPPWWLLLERPEKWPWGLDDWEKEYVGRLDTWLGILATRESLAVEKGNLKPDCTLSDRMRQSWETGAFWINYAAQNSWAFDVIWFNRLDKMFFGNVGEQLEVSGNWLAQRLPLLTETQRQNIEPFVRRKMAQKADRRLVDARFDAFL